MIERLPVMAKRDSLLLRILQEQPEKVADLENDDWKRSTIFDYVKALRIDGLLGKGLALTEAGRVHLRALILEHRLSTELK